MNPQGLALLILKIFLAVSLPVSFFLGTLAYQVLDENYYYDQFKQRGVYENLPDRDVDAVLRSTLDYFRGTDNAIDETMYTQREISHLADVRELINDAKRALYVTVSLQLVSLLVILAMAKQAFLKQIKGPVIVSAGISLTFALIMFLLSINFSYSFLIFHRIFFLGDTFLFPASSTLILMFPEGFFQHTLFRVMMFTIGELFLLFGLVNIGDKFLRKTREI